MVGDHLDPNANAATLIMSILCIAALLIMKRWPRRVSGPLIVVALTILAMRLWDLRNDGIALINPGLPLPALPTSAGARISSLRRAAFGTYRTLSLDRQGKVSGAASARSHCDEHHPLR
jgi:MFS superfamily sulfate permease-like transporter